MSDRIKSDGQKLQKAVWFIRAIISLFRSSSLSRKVIKIYSLSHLKCDFYHILYHFCQTYQASALGIFYGQKSLFHFHSKLYTYFMEFIFKGGFLWLTKSLSIDLIAMTPKVSHCLIKAKLVYCKMKSVRFTFDRFLLAMCACEIVYIYKTGTLQKCMKKRFSFATSWKHHTKVFGLHIKIELNCQTLRVSATVCFII